MNWFQELLSNPFLLIGLSSWFWAQLIKTIIHAIVTKSIDFTRLIGDGGMPSGHSATVSSLATAAALVYGLGSFEFAMAFIFAIVVCKDAMGVRLETGRQAVIINGLQLARVGKASGGEAQGVRRPHAAASHRRYSARRGEHIYHVLLRTVREST